MTPQTVKTPATRLLVEQAFRAADYARARDLAAAVFSDDSGAQDDRCAAGLTLASALHRLGDGAGLMRHLPLALALCEAQADSERAFELARIGALACCEGRQFEEALRLAREASLRAGHDAGRQILAVVAHAACFERMGDPWQARRLLTPLPAQARSLGETRILLRVLLQLGGTLISMHQVLRDAGERAEAGLAIEQARDVAGEALALAHQCDDLWLIAVGQSTLAWACLCTGQLDQAAEVLSAARSGAAVGHLNAVRWRLQCIEAEIDLARQDPEAARRHVEAILAEAGMRLHPSTLLHVYQLAYRAYAGLGDVPRALAHLEQCQSLERQRTAEQMRAQARELVSRFEVESALRQAESANGEAREYRRRADALADVALKDALTGVLNRRGLDERMAAVHQQSSLLATAMVDIDHFKVVNDTYGHAAGDRVLVRLGGLLREHLRPRDVVARYGGEEFALLLAGLTLEEAVDVCERLRVKVENHAWGDIAPGLRLTISVGVAVAPAPAETARDAASDGAPADAAWVLQPADQALYRAKSLGRNQVQFAG